MAGCSKAYAQTGGGTASGGSKSGAVSDPPKREADGQYRIGSKVQVYDGNGKPVDDYFTYFPSKLIMGYDNAVILNLQPGGLALFFGKNNEHDAIGFVRNCIDKSIEWAATAKQNNVRSLRKEIPYGDGYEVDDGTAWYGIKTQLYNLEYVYLMFTFLIGDIFEKGKEETWLVMQYLTQNQARSMSQGRFICFREDDFARLKEMFSESYLAEIDKQEAAHAEQDALFE
ncbi:hypothetical protein AGMMS49546_26140 [Spirochaetia bacterium]|nr:hypothetical protein AGMMS49546_26140 [Spirochaetia bacterium]